jgi:hypothetical protein
MDLAQTIFQVGVGVGALLVGLGVVLAALSLRPVARDARRLASDARRLVALTEAELPAILADAREVGADVEELVTNLAARVDELGDLASSLEYPVPQWPKSLLPPRSTTGPVQSADAREDERIA